MKLISLLPDFARRKALPAPDLVPHREGDPLSIAFKIAAYGRKFSTQTYHKPLLQTGDAEYMRAVALRPDQWRVIKVIQQHKIFGGEEQVRVLAEKASFVEAAEILLGYEMTTTAMGLVRVEGEGKVHGFDHVLDFCLREGLVPDMKGKLHPLIDGDIVSAGQFETVHLQKARQFSNPDADAALKLPQQWHATFLDDLFQRPARAIKWNALNQEIKNAVLMRDFMLRTKSICLLIEKLNENGNDEDGVNLDEFIIESDYRGLHWKPKTLLAWRREKNIIGSMLSDTVQRFERETLSESMGEDMVIFLRDLYVFDLTRRIKWNLGTIGANVGQDACGNIDGWLKQIRELMRDNRHGKEMIQRAESIALNADVQFDAIPSAIQDRMNAFEAYYFAMQKNLGQTMGIKTNPQLPLFPS